MVDYIIVHGPDPKFNPNLFDAIARAKKASVPKATIEAAIARGQGKSSTGATLQTMIEEAMPLPGVAIIVEALTDNKVASKLEIRQIFKTLHVTPSSTTYLFGKMGRLLFPQSEVHSLEAVMEVALDVGAVDVEEDERGWFVYAHVERLRDVTAAITTQLGLDPIESEIIWHPKELIELEDEKRAQLDILLDKLTELPTTKEIYTNIKS